MMDLEVDRLWNEPVILDREGHLLRVQSTRSLSVLKTIGPCTKAGICDGYCHLLDGLSSVQDAGRSASGIRRCSCITNLKIVDRCGSKAFNCQMDSLFQPTSAQSRSLSSFERLLERTAP